jgi:hypothetical protein
VWEVLVDASFTLDILINFRTAYMSTEAGGVLVSDPFWVIYHYLKGFFVLDFLSTAPWDVIMTNESLGLFQLIKVSKVLKLVRILRFLKLVRILRVIQVYPLSAHVLQHQSTGCCRSHHKIVPPL